MNTDTLPYSVIEAAINQSNDGIVITDARQTDNPIVYANQAFYDLTGYSEQEVIGYNCRFLQGELTEPENIDIIRQSVKSHTSCRVRLVNYTKSGDLFHNELSITPVETDGEVTHFIGVQHDITKLVEQEKALAEAADVNKKINALLVEHENLMHTNKHSST